MVVIMCVQIVVQVVIMMGVAETVQFFIANVVKTTNGIMMVEEASQYTRMMLAQFLAKNIGLGDERMTKYFSEREYKNNRRDCFKINSWRM